MSLDTTGPDLLKQLRDAALVPRDVPIVLFGLPRWSALALSRARAAELGTKLIQAHSESLRYKENGNLAIVLWLPLSDHPNKGVHLLCHAGFEAGVVIGWADRHPLQWPRTFTESPAALLAWSSESRPGCDLANISKRLQNEACKLTRRGPAIVEPSPAIMQVIMQHAPKELDEVVEEHLEGDAL
jgi:hypothetical protein